MADAAQGSAADLDAVLLEVVVCPVCRGPLEPRGTFLVCATCACGYPVRDGVPVLLEDDAVPEADLRPADDVSGDPA